MANSASMYEAPTTFQVLGAWDIIVNLSRTYIWGVWEGLIVNDEHNK